LNSAHQREVSRICCAEIEVWKLKPEIRIFLEVARTGMRVEGVNRASKIGSLSRIEEN
jgi:hypothetical protein